jgi:hypothetical protein
MEQPLTKNDDGKGLKIGGLYLEGAEWNNDGGTLKEATSHFETQLPCVNIFTRKAEYSSMLTICIFFFS